MIFIHRNKMTKFSPEVSIIIPAFNAAKEIPYQLEALLNQKEAPTFEVIVADNGSTDNLDAAVKKFVDKLDVRIIDASQKSGASYARNIAVHSAQSNLIMACDADDVVSESWVKSIYSIIKDKDCIVATPTASFHPHLGEEPHDVPADRITSHPLVGLNYKPFAQSGTTGYWRSSFIEIGGMDESFQGGSEDIDFSWRLTETGRSLEWAPDAILYYRARSDNKTVFQQVYRYARENVLLWKRAKDRGTIINSVSFKVSILRAAMVPILYIKSRSWNDIAGYGGRLGALSGNIKYRLLKIKANPEFMWDSIPESKKLN